MSKGKAPSIATQIVEKLYSEGAMTVTQMCETIKYPYKSVYTKALWLQQMNLAYRDNDGLWQLREGISPSTLETGEISTVRPEAEVPGEGEPAGKAPPITRSPGAPLDPKGVFIQRLQSAGVTPKEIVPTIADIFFSGDIDSLPWLNQVLTRDSASFVAPNQKRIIISFWAHTRGLPYDEQEFDFEADAEGKGKKSGAKGVKAEERLEKRLDPGLGWKVDRDRDGSWIARPGGPMSYQEAIDAAERRALIDSYNRGGAGEEAEGEGIAEEGVTGRKGGKRPESLVEYMMKKMIDSMLDGGKGKASEESETVSRLTERIDTMERERQEERFERLEGMIAGIASRDPWEDYDRIQTMKEKLGVGGPTVTDQSPAVQLIKDTTDKMDKNVNRLVGVIERTALRSDEFTPEKTRSPHAREEKAGELLDVVQSRDRSRALRRDAFNV